MVNWYGFKKNDSEPQKCQVKDCKNMSTAFVIFHDGDMKEICESCIEKYFKREVE